MFLAPTILPDWVADSYISSPSKKSLHFHHLNSNNLEMSIRVCENIVKNEAFNTIYIIDSEQHHVLFEAIQQTKLKYNRDKSIFEHLTMRLLNDVVKKLNEDNKETMDIRKIIGNDYFVPECFQACIFQLSELCLSIVDCGIIRCHTNIQVSDMLRWSCNYKISNQYESKALPHPCARQARNFEEKCKTRESDWPYKIPKSETEDFSNFCFFKISNTSLLNKHVHEWEKYLQDLLKFDKQGNINEYRNVNQKQSKHIPAVHGRTFYGHYIQSNLELFQLFEPLTLKICNFNDYYVTTCDLTVQFQKTSSKSRNFKFLSIGNDSENNPSPKSNEEN